MDAPTARRLFPALTNVVFLDTAAMGLLPEPASRAVADLAHLAASLQGKDTEEVYETMAAERPQAAREIARLIGASPDEIALMESTTHGLNMAALSLPLRRGDEVLMPDTEFIQVPIPWARLAEEKGVRLKFFGTRDGVFDAEDVERHLTRRTKVLTLSSVQWSSGFRCDLGSIARLCRRRGIYTVIDAIQHVGVVELDVSRTPLDFVACGGHKWLNAPMGCGFLYIRKSLLKSIAPPIRGYQGLGEPRGGWEHYFHRPTITPNRRFRFPKKAAAFEIGGTANYPGAVALKVATEIANGIGIVNVERHVAALTDRFLAGLDELGLRVITSRTPEERAGIVVFRAYPKPAEDLALTRKLRDRRILLSMRYTSRVGGIRTSFHYFNNEEDVDRLVDAIRELK